MLQTEKVNELVDRILTSSNLEFMDLLSEISGNEFPPPEMPEPVSIALYYRLQSLYETVDRWDLERSIKSIEEDSRLPFIGGNEMNP